MRGGGRIDTPPPAHSATSILIFPKRIYSKYFQSSFLYMQIDI
jgi:hypothetical protein